MDEGEPTFRPYGLDTVQDLGQKVIPILTKKLDEEIHSINTDATPYRDLIGNTQVGSLISTLGFNTDPKTVETLGRISEMEEKKYAQLKLILSEIDPKSKARGLKQAAQRFRDLTSRINETTTIVGDAAIQILKSKDDGAQMAISAEGVAAKAFSAQDNLLPGTGELVWRQLFACTCLSQKG